MIYTITITISVLVAINFILLEYSCNKIKKTKRLNSKRINKPFINRVRTTTPQLPNQLSPTGS